MCDGASFPTSLAPLGILILKKYFFAHLIEEELYFILICIFITLPNIT